MHNFFFAPQLSPNREEAPVPGGGGGSPPVRFSKFCLTQKSDGTSIFPGWTSTTPVTYFFGHPRFFGWTSPTPVTYLGWTSAPKDGFLGGRPPEKPWTSIGNTLRVWGTSIRRTVDVPKNTLRVWWTSMFLDGRPVRFLS